MDTASLYWGLVLGSVGMGYCVYGKKQQKGMALLSGVLLMILPYVVSDNLLLALLALALAALPFFIQI
ncbi:MAG: hypothetical protein HYV27_11785 [Candidatus Hydrogenedentes bacterium]|nr:hypothetical protein [Candidatus Hydrogenedentota bacterium]